ncbi:MAG: peptidoglycan editing factor PgeF [Roseibium sp.]|uniref:peptidoglycan editing factor PgeF n=1 Tax=Roseibium sp. TaxID=1936156 RepID=UPI001B10D65F|nr:peptidoglycan editing factor PgeF [Roseibium sp.]MBO6894173.1 peptidoglycan editing factor PgeF [Roseibium sp.]MBO6932031.1 peptidoglycan editing factor PgeF [Roseibium sp.]
MKIEAEDLKIDGVRHGFFTRNGGVSQGIYASLNIGLGSDDARDLVMENRQRVATDMGVDVNLLMSPYQVHSPDVITLSSPWQDGADRKADALVTDTPGLAIGVSTADCGPVLFADPKAKVVGAAHSGWKGAITGVLENTVKAMEGLGAKSDNIVAVLGPTISQKAYEVGPEFQKRFAEQDKANEIYFLPSEKPGHFMFNLPGFITNRLEELGLAQVADLAVCTYADEERYFSYRRTTHRQEPDYGRQISAIVID